MVVRKTTKRVKRDQEWKQKINFYDISKRNVAFGKSLTLITTRELLVLEKSLIAERIILYRKTLINQIYI